MKISVRLRRYLILLIVLAFAAGIGAFAVSRSEPAKSMGVDIFFDIAWDIYMLGFWAYLLKKNWHTWKSWGKIGLVLLMGVIALIMVSDIYDNWHRLPWVKAKAFTTVDEFMTDLKEQDYTTATTRFTPRMRQCVNPDDLNQPDAQPANWELSEMDKFSNILGTATFSDGQELSLTVRMVWSDGRWQINGFWFGEWPEARLDYSSMHCGE